MAVAAYASLLSLIHLLDNLHYRAPFHLPHLNINLVQTLQLSVHSLLDFLELHHLQTESPEIVGLWRHLAEVAFEAQQMVDSHVVNLLYLRSLAQTCTVVNITHFCDDLVTMISKLDIIKKDLQDQIQEACNKPAVFVPTVAAPSATFSSGKSRVVVGFDDHVIRIMDQLTINQGRLQILPIVGMGGIGKTTLARCVHSDPYVVNYFDRRIWVTVSQQFSVQQILMRLLADLERNNSTYESSIDVLGQRLHKELFDRRYLVIMDDMWSTEAWDELRRYFPDNENGSRVLVTTRDSNVAACLGTLDKYLLSFLDGDASWDLFCQITFGQRGCPYVELEEIGRAITKSCRGLPLEISVIGRLLANSNMTQEYWRDVGENISSFGNLEDNEHCLRVLFLSYQSLPIHLKSCFLYLRVFPEDANIYPETIIIRWLVEGYIKPSSDKTLEEVGEQYVKDLNSRSLIFMTLDPYNKETEYIGVHDLLRDLCVRESIKENFIQSPKIFDRRNDAAGAGCCLLCGTSMRTNDASYICMNIVRFPPSSHGSLARVSCDAACQRKYSHITKMKLVTAMTTLRRRTILRCREIRHSLEFSTEVRYLYWGKADHFVFNRTIHLLWNLEVLNIFGSFDSSPILIPPEIWEMPSLRLLKADYKAFLANPTAAQMEENGFIILKNLWILENISNFECSKEVVDRIPNLKRLSIKYESDKSVHQSMVQPHYSLCNMAQLQKLECLDVWSAKENITFPNSLKQLRLWGCRMAWEDMSIIGSLPVLERLILDRVIEGSEWNPEEGEFVQLKKLAIWESSLKHWTADSIHFPVLEKLELSGLKSLEGIPLGIGDIPTLQLIVVVMCNDSVNKSAKDIREDQQELGNETLEVVVRG